jgi:hypothetical protein
MGRRSGSSAGRTAAFPFATSSALAFLCAMPPKRRSNANASFHPLKWVLITGGVFLVLLVVGLLVVKSMVNGWLQGDGFRDWLAGRASSVMRSEVTLAELEWEGSEVYAKRFDALGSKDAGFSSLVLDGVRAKAAGIVDRAVQVPEITVNRLDLRFSPERKAAAPETDAPAPAATAPELPAWLSKYLPDRVEIDEIGVASVRVSVAKAEGEVFLLNGAKATLKPDFRTGFWEIEGSGGKVTLPNQPEIALKDLGLRWKGEDLFLDRCALGVFKNGHVDGKGEIGFAHPGRFDLELGISAVDVDELVAGEWRDRLTGTVHGPVRITGAPGALVFEGTMHLEDGVIEAVPVLKRISQYTRSERFERLVLNQAQTDFKRDGDRLELRNLVLQSDGLVRVEGQVDLVADRIAGDLRVGVTPGTMRWIPGAERLVFTEDRDGFLWAPMKLAGSLAEPKEDLSARLIAAAGEAVISELPGGVLDAAEGLLKPGDGKTPTDPLIDQGKKVIDLLSPFLKAP